VYASWDGATDFTGWRVLAGSSPDTSSMKQVGQFRKASFETQMWVGSTAPYFAVQALSSQGQVRGTSAGIAR
jgi:hypothetical protein